MEEFVTANQAEWDATVAQIQASGGDIMDVEVAVEGNRIIQIMKFKETYDDEQVATMKDSLEQNTEQMKTTIPENIKQIEQQVGVTGISWYFDYQNGNGESIYSLELTGE